MRRQVQSRAAVHKGRDPERPVAQVHRTKKMFAVFSKSRREARILRSAASCGSPT